MEFRSLECYPINYYYCPSNLHRIIFSIALTIIASKYFLKRHFNNFPQQQVVLNNLTLNDSKGKKLRMAVHCAYTSFGKLKMMKKIISNIKSIYFSDISNKTKTVLVLSVVRQY